MIVLITQRDITLVTNVNVLSNLLKKEGIVLHMDEKLPGKTWLFDNAANDNMHHSARCHRAWADRLVGLIDENTSR